MRKLRYGLRLLRLLCGFRPDSLSSTCDIQFRHVIQLRFGLSPNAFALAQITTIASEIGQQRSLMAIPQQFTFGEFTFPFSVLRHPGKHIRGAGGCVNQCFYWFIPAWMAGEGARLANEYAPLVRSGSPQLKYQSCCAHM